MKLTDREIDQCTKGRSHTPSERDIIFCRLDCWHHAGHDRGRNHHLVSLSARAMYLIASRADHIVKGGLATKKPSKLDQRSYLDR
jgi:hypothetical protein